MQKQKKKKYSSLEYIKIILTTDKRNIFVIVIQTISSLFWTLVPLGLTSYILTIYQENPTADGYKTIILACGIYTLLRILLSGVPMFLYNLLIDRISRKFFDKIETKILKKVLDVDLETYQSSQFLNNYQKVIDNAANNMMNTFWDVGTFLEQFVALIGIGAIISMINPIIILYGFLIGIISYFISKVTSKIHHKLSEDNKQKIRERGYVRRIYYLKDYAIDLRTTPINDLYLNRNEQFGQDIINNINRSYKKLNFYDSLNRILLNSIFALSLSIVVFEVLKTNNVIMLATLMNAIMYLSEDIYAMAESIASYKNNIIYKNDYFKLMEQFSEIENYDKSNPTIDEFKSIKLNNISFSYGEKQVLNNITLQINKNDKVAIVGENGAGKTTLIKLLLRLYDVNEGNILLNDIDYRQYNASDIRNQFVTVFQDYQIYALTIAENVLLRKCETKEDEQIVIDALQKVGVWEKVLKLEKGIYTNCTTEFDKKGIEFSGGERQKFVIARIFASKAPILLLDEPNSALDPIAERDIFNEIFKYSVDKTLIFISHRFSTTINSDKIYLFSNGRITEQGTHQELMSIENGEYKYMFNTQAYEYIKKGDNDDEEV